MPYFYLIIIAVILIFGICMLFWISRKKKISTNEEAFIRNQWHLIQSGENSKNAILEADKLLDFALDKLGFQGSLGEKLKKSGPRFSNLNNVWSAHKLRNRLAHELNFKPNNNEMQRALSNFRKALCDLKIQL
jgi:hypothetical protein